MVLDDLSFVVLLRTPGPMADGDWSVGVVVDQRATPAQHQALAEIGRGAAGGPLEAMAALTSEFLGVESRIIRFRKDGLSRAASIPE